MFWKISFVVLLVLLISSNALWFSSALDAGLANTQHKESFENQTKNVKVFQKILTESLEGDLKKDFLEMARRNFPETGAVVEKDNSVYIYYTRFLFVDGKLKDIAYSY